MGDHQRLIVDAVAANTVQCTISEAEKRGLYYMLLGPKNKKEENVSTTCLPEEGRIRY